MIGADEAIGADLNQELTAKDTNAASEALSTFDKDKSGALAPQELHPHPLHPPLCLRGEEDGLGAPLQG